MPNFAVVDMEGKQVGSIDLSESVFGIEPNTAVMHQMVVNYLANQRHGTQSALTRAEVSGGGRKPWRQKRHRPCKTGFNSFATVDTRWYRICSKAKKLQIYCKQESKKTCYEVSFLS